MSFIKCSESAILLESLLDPFAGPIIAFNQVKRQRIAGFTEETRTCTEHKKYKSRG